MSFIETTYSNFVGSLIYYLTKTLIVSVASNPS